MENGRRAGRPSSSILNSQFSIPRRGQGAFASRPAVSYGSGAAALAARTPPRAEAHHVLPTTPLPPAGQRPDLPVPLLLQGHPDLRRPPAAVVPALRREPDGARAGERRGAAPATSAHAGGRRAPPRGGVPPVGGHEPPRADARCRAPSSRARPARAAPRAGGRTAPRRAAASS